MKSLKETQVSIMHTCVKTFKFCKPSKLIQYICDKIQHLLLKIVIFFPFYYYSFVDCVSVAVVVVAAVVVFIFIY